MIKKFDTAFALYNLFLNINDVFSFIPVAKYTKNFTNFTSINTVSDACKIWTSKYFLRLAKDSLQ